MTVNVRTSEFEAPVTSNEADKVGVSVETYAVIGAIPVNESNCEYCPRIGIPIGVTGLVETIRAEPFFIFIMKFKSLKYVYVKKLHEI